MRRSPALWPLFFLALAWAAAAAVLWCWAGWRIGDSPWSGGAMEALPAPALLAAGLALAAGLILVVSGSPAVHALGHRAKNVPAALALAFLSGGAVGGVLLGVTAFVWLGPGMIGLAAVGALLHLRLGAPKVTLKARVPSAEWIVAGVLLLAVGLAAVGPVVESDGLRYHVAAPEAWLRAGHFVHLPYQANSNLPALQGLLAAAAAPLSLVGRVYQCFSFLFCVALAIVAGEVVKGVVRTVSAARTCGTGGMTVHGQFTGGTPVPPSGIGALLVAGIPVLAILGAWPFSDVASVAFLLAAVWMLLPGTIRGAKVRLILVSLFLGASVAVKISNLPLAAIVGVWALGGAVMRSRVAVWKAALLLALPGLLVLGPWLVKNWMYHGNPLYPLGFGVFGGPEWSAANEAFYKSKMAEKGFGHSLRNLVMSPFDMTVNWPQFEGFNPGPMLMGLLPAAVAGCAMIPGKRRIAARLFSAPVLLAAMIVAGWAVWFRTYQSVRFFVPEILFIAVLGAAGLLAVGARLGRAGWFTARAAVFMIALAGGAWAPAYRLLSSHVYTNAFGIAGEDVAIARRFNSYPAVMWLNQETANNEPVFYIGEFRTAYARNFRPVASDWFDTPLVLIEIRDTPDNEALLRKWRDEGIRYALINQGELSLYERAYFQPRFTPEEWERFVDLRQQLLENVVFDSGNGVFVAKVGGG